MLIVTEMLTGFGALNLHFAFCPRSRAVTALCVCMNSNLRVTCLYHLEAAKTKGYLGWQIYTQFGEWRELLCQFVTPRWGDDWVFTSFLQYESALRIWLCATVWLCNWKRVVISRYGEYHKRNMNHMGWWFCRGSSLPFDNFLFTILSWCGTQSLHHLFLSFYPL